MRTATPVPPAPQTAALETGRGLRRLEWVAYTGNEPSPTAARRRRALSVAAPTLPA
ncbi:hypothetical protein ACFZB9_25845 [Kitasatospora sp. NPDC008050]|uniref:hypothetical protein n=1 Tax=Kitasatospora sp. NPDC008050 TaxID=3364021 RepID=UPI0036F080BD